MKKLLYTATAIMCFCVGSKASAQSDEKDETIDLVSDSGKVIKLTFKRCLPGSIIPGDPRKINDDDVPKSIGPFFISKTELTWEHLHAILGEKEFKEIKAAIVNALPEYKIAKRNKEAAVGLTIQETIKVCRRLMKTHGSSNSIIVKYFRLATQSEWQYACRGVADYAKVRAKQAACNENDRRHFHGWPANLDDVDKLARPKYENLWEKIDANTNFTGTQDDVLRIIEKYYDDENALSDVAYILSKFLIRLFDIA